MTDQMQAILYKEAQYDVLYYPGQLDAYRTDKFGGLPDQPSGGGVPLFGLGSLTTRPRPTPRRWRPRPSRRPRPRARTSSSEAAVASAPAPGRHRPSRNRATRRVATSPILLIISRCLVLVAALAVGFRDASVAGVPALSRGGMSRGIPAPSLISVLRAWVAATSRTRPPGAPDDRRHRRAQLLPVPDDARLPGAHPPAQPERHPGGVEADPRALGSRQAALPGPVRRLLVATAARATSASRSVPRPARHRGHRPADLADGSCSASASSSRSSSGSASGAYSGWRRGGAVDHVGNGVSR